MDGQLTSHAAHTWLLRWEVELDAQLRFARLAGRLRDVGASALMVDAAARAAQDEARHAQHCATLARRLGYTGPAPIGNAAEISPAAWGERERVLYETVAACCVTETESVAVLTTLLSQPNDPGVRVVLQELARDEVGHSRLGWTHLANERDRGAVDFLAPMVPAMMAGAVGPQFFEVGAAWENDGDLFLLGVLPKSVHQATFAQTMHSVVFPGLRTLGVPTHAAQTWLQGVIPASPTRTGPNLR